MDYEDTLSFIEYYINLSTAYGSNNQYWESIEVLEKAQKLSVFSKNHYYNVVSLAQMVELNF